MRFHHHNLLQRLFGSQGELERLRIRSLPTSCNMSPGECTYIFFMFSRERKKQFKAVEILEC